MFQIEDVHSVTKPRAKPRSGNVTIPDKIIKEMRELRTQHTISQVLMLIEERYGLTVNYQYARRVVNNEIRRGVV